MSRITLTTVITGPIKGLKRVIKEFLAENEIGFILQTTTVDVGDSTSRLTVLAMEGEKEKLIETRDLLILDLNVKFAGIKYDVWEQNESDKPWPTTQRIKPTPGSLTRNSSGFLDEELVETCSPNDTWINERILKAAHIFSGHIIKAMNHTTPLLVQAAQTAGEIKQVYSRASSLTDGLVKNADFSYQNRTILLNIQHCLDWTLLVKELKKVFEIAEQSPVNIYKKCDDGAPSQIIHISSIETKERYYIQTETAKFSSEMEEFFERLESALKNPIKKERQMKDVRDAFDNQDIEYDQLMATGDLAMTDEKLKEIGIAQLGLRTAILAVIKSGH